MFFRTLGKSGIEVSAIGMGCWAIGGPMDNEHGKPVGWGQVDDAESIRAIHRAMDLGVTLFDTANVYGTGHSEIVLGRALHGKRDQVVIATKFGRKFVELSRQIDGSDADPAFIRQSCEDSLRRLQTDVIDLYQFHLGGYDPAAVEPVVAVCEELVAAGKIRAYAWSTDSVPGAQAFNQGQHNTAVQFRLNIFERNDPMIAFIEANDLAGLIRGPLGKGLLTGKFASDSVVAENDVRAGWDFAHGTEAERLAKLEQLRDVLTSDGRSLAQAALGWLWARSENVIPIPGFKTVAQIEENIGAADYGPLSAEQMTQVEAILSGQRIG